MNHKVDKLEWFLSELSAHIEQIFIRIVSGGIFVQDGGQTCNYLLDPRCSEWCWKHAALGGSFESPVSVCDAEAVVKNCKLSTGSEAQGCKKAFCGEI